MDDISDAACAAAYRKGAACSCGRELFFSDKCRAEMLAECHCGKDWVRDRRGGFYTLAAHHASNCACPRCCGKMAEARKVNEHRAHIEALELRIAVLSRMLEASEQSAAFEHGFDDVEENRRDLEKEIAEQVNEEIAK